MKIFAFEMILLLLAAFSALSIALTYLIWSFNQSVLDLSHLIIIETIGLLSGIGLYLVSKYVSHRVAIPIFVSLLFLGAVFLDNPVQVFEGRGLLVFAISIVAAGLLIRPISSFIMAFLSCAVNIMFGIILSRVPNIFAMIEFIILAILVWFLSTELENMLEEIESFHEKAKLSEERFRTLVESSSEGIVVVKDRIVLFANSESRRLLCESLGDNLIGQNILDFVAPEFRSTLTDKLREIEERMIPTDSVYIRGMKSDGAIFDTEVTAVPIHFEGSFAIQLVFQDITEKKDMETTIRKLFNQQVESNRLALALAETFEPIKVYRTIFEHVSRVLDTKSFIISQYDLERDLITAVYVNTEGNEIDARSLPSIPLEEKGTGTQSRVIHSGRYFYTPDLQTTLSSTKANYTFDDTGAVSVGSPPTEKGMISRSALYVPLKVAGNVAGVIQVQSHLPDAYSQEDIDLFTSIANVAALAIHKALLFSELNESNQELKRLTEDLTDRVTERELLLKEIHHRVKNNLQVISSLLYLQSKSTTDKSTISLLADSRARIKSISIVHELLYKSEDMISVRLDSYVNELISVLISTYQVDTKRIDFVVDIEKIELTIDTAVPCGIVLNEIISNSMKYAFPGQCSGRISVIGRLNYGNEQTLVISDNGTGFNGEVASNDGRTLGLRMIDKIVRDQLQGTLEIDSENGTTYTITFFTGAG